MAGPQIPVEMGFAEFVAKLISEVFDSVVSAQVEQEDRYAEVAAAASLPPEVFAALHVTPLEVEAEYRQLFPEHPPPAAGSAYRPGSGEAAEEPPFAAVLGVHLEAGDYEKAEDGAVLTAGGAEKLSAAVRERLAAGRVASLRSALARGIPRVVVDSGRITARLTFQVLSEEEAEEEEPAEAPATAALGKRLFLETETLARIASLPRPRVLPQVRLGVRQADERTPQAAGGRSDVFGEVEITFKTVT